MAARKLYTLPARLSMRMLTGLRSELRGGLGEAVWLFVTMRLGLSLFAFLASFIFDLPGPCTWDDGSELNVSGFDFRLLGVWQRWDACWYLKVAAVGYRPGDATVAFFPVFPRLISLLDVLLGGNVTLSGLVVSGIAYIIAITGLYRLVQGDFDDHVAQRTVLYISVFPTAFFFFAPYSEAVYLALAVWTLYLARRGAWAWAPVPALCIGLAQVQGLLLSIPLACEFLHQRRRAAAQEGATEHPSLAALAVALLPIGGFALFTIYTQVLTGWTPSEAQATWGRTMRAPWTALALSWQHIRTQGDTVEALNLFMLLLFVVLVLLGLRRLPLSYSVYAASQLLLAASQPAFFSPLMSTSRFVLVLFPAFVVLALLTRNYRLHYSWLVLSLLVLGLLLYAFLSGPFVAQWRMESRV